MLRSLVSLKSVIRLVDRSGSGRGCYGTRGRSSSPSITVGTLEAGRYGDIGAAWGDLDSETWLR